jgi:SH3-like domain-containing protein
MVGHGFSWKRIMDSPGRESWILLEENHGFSWKRIMDSPGRESWILLEGELSPSTGETAESSARDQDRD